jgi:hypothetical protein
MTIHFSPSLTQVESAWTAFKNQLAIRALGSVIQYDESPSDYTIFAVEGYLVFWCQIWKGTVPEGSYTQVQNDADKTDFETNFKAYANRSVDDVPSHIIANSIKTSGGSSNLAVNGSVTPVVFEYNPPNNYDIHVNALSFLFEDTTALAFGNKFILSTIGTLANGLLLETKAGDAVTSPWQNMKRTRDLIEICHDFDIATGTVNFMRVKVHLPQSLYLSRNGTFTNPDYIRITVRDDLTALDFAEAHFQGVKL